jgi:hypothetical protein
MSTLPHRRQAKPGGPGFPLRAVRHSVSSRWRPRYLLMGCEGLLLALLLAAILGAPSSSVAAQTTPAMGEGFRILAEQIPGGVGEVIDAESPTAEGDIIQHTTLGELLWRKIDNVPIFSDETTAWLDGPYGLQSRPAGSTFLWEPVEPARITYRALGISSTAWTPEPGAMLEHPILGLLEGPDPKQPGAIEGDFTFEGWAVVQDCPPGRPGVVDAAQILVRGPMGSDTAVRLDEPGHALRIDRPEVAALLGGDTHAALGFAVPVDTTRLANRGIIVFRIYLHAPCTGWWSRTVVLSVEPRTPDEPEAGSLVTCHQWTDSMEDRRLQDALAYAYHFGPDWRPVAECAAALGATAQWGSLPWGADGQYDPERNLILINDALRYEPVQVIAAVLAHEAYHASKRGEAVDASDYLYEEIEAFKMQAYIWAQMPAPSHTTAKTRIFGMLVRELEKGMLEQVILNSAYYQERASAPVLQ